MTNRADELRSAAALAKDRFSAVQAAFNAMESAHKRGDYSPAPDLQARLDEFRSAASEVQRLATEFISASGPHPEPRRVETVSPLGGPVGRGRRQGSKPDKD